MSSCGDINGIFPICLPIHRFDVFNAAHDISSGMTYFSSSSKAASTPLYKKKNIPNWNQNQKCIAHMYFTPCGPI